MVDDGDMHIVYSFKYFEKRDLPCKQRKNSLKQAVEVHLPLATAQVMGVQQHQIADNPEEFLSARQEGCWALLGLAVLSWLR